VRAAAAARVDGTGGVSRDNDSDSTPDSGHPRAGGRSGRSRGQCATSRGHAARGQSLPRRAPPMHATVRVGGVTPLCRTLGCWP